MPHCCAARRGYWFLAGPNLEGKTEAATAAPPITPQMIEAVTGAELITWRRISARSTTAPSPTLLCAPLDSLKGRTSIQRTSATPTAVEMLAATSAWVANEKLNTAPGPPSAAASMTKPITPTAGRTHHTGFGFAAGPSDTVSWLSGWFKCHLRLSGLVL
jgi:hypothetical protein